MFLRINQPQGPSSLQGGDTFIVSSPMKPESHSASAILGRAVTVSTLELSQGAKNYIQVSHSVPTTSVYENVSPDVFSVFSPFLLIEKIFQSDGGH